MAMQFCQLRFVLRPHSYKMWSISPIKTYPCLLFQVFTPDGSIVDGEIVDHKNGTYEFVYMVPKEGDFSLALRLYDQHIKGSPFKLTVARALEAEAEVKGQNNLKRRKNQSV